MATVTEDNASAPPPDAAAATPATVDAAPPAPAKYRVGTLTYTKAGLVALFFWLLWGDFCLTLMETVIPTVLPIKLQSLQAPATLIALLMTTIPHTLTVLVTPAISFRSDRFRSRWGRRIPFLLVPTPILAVLLALIGYAEPIGRAVAPLVSASPATATLLVISVLLVAFQFFNMFVTSIYYYLFNDVVPDVVLARFMALFRVVGAAAGWAYHTFIFPYAQTHMVEIFVGAGVLYGVGFGLMCLMVREGQYPPPPPKLEGRTGLIASIRTYAVECFTHRFYWDFFLANASWTLVGAASAFGVLFSLSMGLTTTQLGYIAGTAQLVSMFILYPAGMLTDRLHPLRVVLIVVGIYIPLYAVPLCYLFFDPAPSTVLTIAIAHAAITLPVAAMWNTAELPLFMKLLPRERYGQFASANALVRSAAMIVGGLVAGGLIDLMRAVHGGSDFAYRYIPLWQVSFFTLSLVFYYRVYRQWKARGGDAGYTPPTV